MASIQCHFAIILTFCMLIVLHQAQGSPKLSASDIDALVSIKDSMTDLPGSTFFSTWDFTGPDPCSTFSGVTCALSSSSSDTLRVTVLELGTGLSGSLGLAGSLPQSISQLTELTQLILNPGMVTGPIPAQLGHQQKGLRVLFLSHNRLTGPIPPSLAELTQLHTLDLSFNHLIGVIPPIILTELTQLKVIVLANNQLTGELPEPTQSLFHLDVKSNQLTGPIPTSLPSTLRYVSLSQNLMWGPINGTILETLPDISYLDLSYNQFSGSIPLCLLRSSLPTLLLSHNNFSSVSVSDTVSEPSPYPQGSTVDLSHNALPGSLPEAAAGAENIFLNNNRFGGPVPISYVDGIREGRIKTLYLQHNFLDKFPRNLGGGATLPDNAEVCLAYNCMVPPLGLNMCPTSAGGLLSRPATQCAVFRNDKRNHV